MNFSSLDTSSNLGGGTAFPTFLEPLVIELVMLASHPQEAFLFLLKRNGIYYVWYSDQDKQ